MKALSRRNFFSKSLLSTGGLMISGAAFSSPIPEAKEAKPISPPKIIFFDVNETLLDFEPLKTSVTKVLKGRKELVPLWFTTMLQYSLVATVGDHYRDFGEIGAATLQMVAQNHNISLSADKVKEALKPIRSLSPHTEVPEALAKLKEAGYKLKL